METFINDYITKERLKPYLRKTNYNLKKALKLYEINMAYSSELYKLLSILEISLRNLVNKRCIDLFGYNWLTNIKWDIHYIMIDKVIRNRTTTEKTRLEMEKIFSVQEDILKDTIERLKEEDKPITNDYIVSRSIFSFWTRFFNKAYKDILWGGVLSNIFNNKFERNKIEHILNEFRWLRNRIAHNGCVIDMKYSPENYYNKILNLLEIINPKLSNWAKKQVNEELFS